MKFKPTDEVKKFVANNSHQFGYIMQEASRQWLEKDPVGALTVGTCKAFVDKYGDYHELQEKAERYEKALKEIAESDDDSSCNELALKYEVIAEKALNR